jgi:hypothetical protein
MPHGRPGPARNAERRDGFERRDGGGEADADKTGDRSPETGNSQLRAGKGWACGRRSRVLVFPVSGLWSPVFFQSLRRHREHHAALVLGERVEFVGDQETGRTERSQPAGLAEQERKAFRRRDEDVRRTALLLRALLGRGVARPRSDLQPIPAKFVEGLLEVFAQIVGEGPER